MHRCLTDRQRAIVAMAGELADRIAPRAAEHDRDGSFPHDNIKLLQGAGYLNLTVPKELGGLGASLLEMTLAQERLAMGCGATALVVSMHLSPAGQLAARWRRERDARVERLLRDIANGEVVLATVPAEAGHSILMTSNTIARRVDGGFRVSGKKIFGTATAMMTHLTSMARLDDPLVGSRVLFFRIPRATPGLFVHTGGWDTLGMRATQSVDMTLDEVLVPDDAVFHSYPVGHFDQTMLQSTWSWAMPSFGSIYLGIAAGAMELAKRTVRTSGRADSPQLQHLFAEMEVLLETARATLWRVCEEVMSGAILDQLTVQQGMARVVLAKNVATNNAVAIMDRVMQAVGGSGYHKRLPFERLYRDVRAGTIHPYNNLEADVLFGKTALDIEIAPESAPSLPARSAAAPTG